MLTGEQGKAWRTAVTAGCTASGQARNAMPHIDVAYSLAYAWQTAGNRHCSCWQHVRCTVVLDT
jgi:hypothetical protein